MFEFLNTDMGSAKNNNNTPIHNWYKFTAGFSHLFVDGIIKEETAKTNTSPYVFDPFAGCGTTLVSSQKLGVRAVGNESQEFMYDVIQAKLNWKIDKVEFEEHMQVFKTTLQKEIGSSYIEKVQHPLLISLYTPDTLKILYALKELILAIPGYKFKYFFKLALSQTLHKVSIHPIAVPYISRSKTLSHTDKPFEMFEKISRQMFDDTRLYVDMKKTSKIYLHDSRKINHRLENNECNLCITSPPYLNNLDYGEVSKVHSHFFDITNDWNDITTKVRKNLVTGSTTHYTEAGFNLEQFQQGEFYLANTEIANNLITVADKIKAVSKERSGKKSFHILTLLYFQDMYFVLKEIRRVLQKGSNAYLVLGDSAPYGVFVPTTEILGKISKSVEFDSYSIRNIRTRGTKWKSLKYRHNLDLAENVLTLV